LTATTRVQKLSHFKLRQSLLRIFELHRSLVNILELKNLKYSKEGSFLSPEENIGVIKLNRPQTLNAFNRETLIELDSLLEEIRRDDQIKVVVIIGEGEKSFSTGLDLKETSTLDEAAAKSLIELGQSIFRKIENFEKPVIAAINGYALGGGLELALACDMRIASENAKIGSTEVKLGLFPGWGGTQRLPKILGKGRASELILTGGMIDAKEAERIGLVNKVVPHDELTTTVSWTAGTIASNAPVAVREAKRLVKASFEVDITEGNKLEAEAIVKCLRTEDLKEGMKALFEKRNPQFKGR